MFSQLQNTPLATERRALSGNGTGVATYGSSLRQAQSMLSGRSSLLDEDASLSNRLWARPARWGRALYPGARRIDSWLTSTLFADAQVHFDIYGTLMHVRVPGPPGIMHWSYPHPILITGWRNLHTVHDVIPLLHPHLTDIDPRRHLRIIRAITAKSDGLVAVSETARSDMIHALGCPPAFVTNCGIAVDLPPAGESHTFRSPTERPYFLVLGRVEPRKNIASILQAYRDSNTDQAIVFAGPDGPGADELDRMIRATPGAIRLPYVEAPALRPLIAHATALLMPSLAEGFGLPIIEAMSVGTPVLTANRGSTAEVAGGAALLVDPEDLPQLAKAIGQLGRDKALRERLAADGRINAARFSRESFAERLEALYARMLPL